MDIIVSTAPLPNVAIIIPPALTGTLLGLFRFNASGIGKNLLYGGAAASLVGSPVQQNGYANLISNARYVNTGIPDQANLSLVVCARAPSGIFTTSPYTTGPLLAGSISGASTGAGMLLSGGTTGPGSSTARLGPLAYFSDGIKTGTVTETNISGQTAAITSISYNGTVAIATLSNAALLLPQAGTVVIAGNAQADFNGTFTMTVASAGSFSFVPTTLPASGTTGAGGTGTYSTPGVWAWRFYGMSITSGVGLQGFDLTNNVSGTLVADTNASAINANNSVYIGGFPGYSASVSPVDIAYAAIGTGLTLADMQKLRAAELSRLALAGITNGVGVPL